MTFLLKRIRPYKKHKKLEISQILQKLVSFKLNSSFKSCFVPFLSCLNKLALCSSALTYDICPGVDTTLCMRPIHPKPKQDRFFQTYSFPLVSLVIQYGRDL